MAAAAALLIGRSLQRLTNAANFIGSGGIPVPISSGIVEIDRVSTALSASAQLRSDSEATALQQQLLLQAVFNSNPDCMMLADIDRKAIRVNPAFERVFQWETGAFVGNSTRSICADPADWLEVGNRLEADPRAVVAGRYSLVRKNGEEFPALITAVKLVDNTGTFIAYLSIIRDITIDLQREQMLLEKRNLEALGRLSSGIAHDFNNMLTIVSANMQLAELRTDDPECVELINKALHATNMAARLSQRLMRFASRSRLMPVPADLNALANSALEIVRRTMGEAVVIDARLGANPAWVRVDESELENALVNLALNGRDAMPEGGRLTVVTGNTRVESGDPLISAGLAAGDYVYLSVSDTGIGMTDEVKARALEPFFTTKEPGKGTGLGLTTIHGFVAQLGGALRIDSALRRGTRVMMLLPLQDQTKSSDAADASLVCAQAGRGERILLVEDNSFVRETTTKLLQVLGYRVVGAENGTEALAIVESGQKFELVISDVMMPGALSGLDVLRRLAETNPELAVLLYSGNPDAWQDASYSPPEKHILRKPFTSLQLSSAIDRALNGRLRTSA